MLHKVYLFKKGALPDFTKKQLMEWAPFQELLKKQEKNTIIMRYNIKRDKWYKYEK